MYCNRKVVKTNKFLYEFDKLQSDITNMYINYKIFICGDFNIDLSKRSRQNNEFVNIINAKNLTCINTSPTRIDIDSESLLDNIPTNLQDFEAINIITGMSDHYA